jgi:RecJ-like exonuclease
MVEDQQKRQTARKLWIRDLLGSSYIKEEGMKPNYVLLQDQSRASRINFFGAVVSVSTEGLPSIVLDDGTGRIIVRAFEENAQLNNLKIGDVIIVIGRPRQFNNEMYVLPEIIRVLPDIKWLEVRKRELAKNPLITAPAKDEVVVEEIIDDSFRLSEQVLNAIRSLDQGQGADTESVIESVGAQNAEKTISFLLQNGDVFEVSPGRLKVLE